MIGQELGMFGESKSSFHGRRSGKYIIHCIQVHHNSLSYEHDGMKLIKDIPDRTFLHSWGQKIRGLANVKKGIDGY